MPIPGRSLPRVTGAELVDLCRAQWALLRAQFTLWSMPRGALISPTHDSASQPLTPAQRLRARAIGWSVTRAAAYGLFRPKCFARSLALQRMLRNAGIGGSRLHLGVRPTPTGLLAHAWITLEGGVLGDDASFVADFKELPATRASDFQ